MAVRRPRRPGEFELIARYFRPLATDPRRLRPDRRRRALLAAAGRRSGADHRHDRRRRPLLRRRSAGLDRREGAARQPLRPRRQGRRRPFGYLLSLALPHDWTEAWVGRFAARPRGRPGTLRRHAARRRHHPRLRRPHHLDHRARPRPEGRDGAPLGRQRRRRHLRLRHDRRCRARPPPAAAAPSIASRRGGARSTSSTATCIRSRAWRWRRVLRRYATSAMDVSDGLVGDLAHICEVSGVGAEIEAARCRCRRRAAPGRRRPVGALPTILTGGDDYEILATVPEPVAARFRRAARGGRRAGDARSARSCRARAPPVVREPRRQADSPRRPRPHAFLTDGGRGGATIRAATGSQASRTARPSAIDARTGDAMHRETRTPAERAAARRRGLRGSVAADRHLARRPRRLLSARRRQVARDAAGQRASSSASRSARSRRRMLMRPDRPPRRLHVGAPIGDPRRPHRRLAILAGSFAALRLGLLVARLRRRVRPSNTASPRPIAGSPAFRAAPSPGC